MEWKDSRFNSVRLIGQPEKSKSPDLFASLKRRAGRLLYRAPTKVFLVRFFTNSGKQTNLLLFICTVFSRRTVRPPFEKDFANGVFAGLSLFFAFYCRNRCHRQSFRHPGLPSPTVLSLGLLTVLGYESDSLLKCCPWPYSSLIGVAMIGSSKRKPHVSANRSALSTLDITDVRRTPSQIGNDKQEIT